MAKKIEVVTSSELAQRLGVSPAWVRMVCKDRNLAPMHGVKGHVHLYDASQVGEIGQAIQEIKAGAREKRALNGKAQKNLAHLDEVRRLRRAREARETAPATLETAPLFPAVPETPPVPVPSITTTLGEVTTLLLQVIDRLAAIERIPLGRVSA